MRFFGFGKKEKIEGDPLPKETVEQKINTSVALVYKTSHNIYDNILNPLIKIESHPEKTLFLRKETQYTDSNMAYVLFELSTYIYFRIDLAFFSIGVTESVRSQFGFVCADVIISHVYPDAPENFLTEQLNIRLSRYDNTARALCKGGAKGSDLIRIMDELALSFIKRAVNSNSLSDWEMCEKTTIPPLGLVTNLQLAPKIIEMENGFIGPLTAKTQKILGKY